jgi:hypothetical protein
MNIEFLESGSKDCPLIRIYGNEPAVCQRLMVAFEQLADGRVEEICLTGLPGAEPLGGCCLIALAGRPDQGIVRKASNVFWWILTPGSWDNVASLIEPFCQRQAGGHQWLDQVPASEAKVLISTTGEW